MRTARLFALAAAPAPAAGAQSVCLPAEEYGAGLLEQLRHWAASADTAAARVRDI